MITALYMRHYELIKTPFDDFNSALEYLSIEDYCGDLWAVGIFDTDTKIAYVATHKGYDMNKSNSIKFVEAGYSPVEYKSISI
jgi:hypothetical protein